MCCCILGRVAVRLKHGLAVVELQHDLQPHHVVAHARLLVTDKVVDEREDSLHHRRVDMKEENMLESLKEQWEAWALLQPVLADVDRCSDVAVALSLRGVLKELGVDGAVQAFDEGDLGSQESEKTVALVCMPSAHKRKSDSKLLDATHKFTVTHTKNVHAHNHANTSMHKHTPHTHIVVWPHCIESGKVGINYRRGLRQCQNIPDVRLLVANDGFRGGGDQLLAIAQPGRNDSVPVRCACYRSRLPQNGPHHQKAWCPEVSEKNTHDTVRHMYHKIWSEKGMNSLKMEVTI